MVGAGNRAFTRLISWLLFDVVLFMFRTKSRHERERRRAGRERVAKLLAETDEAIAEADRVLADAKATFDVSDARMAAAAAAVGLRRYAAATSGNPYYRNEIPPPLTGYLALRGDALFGYEIHATSHHTPAISALIGVTLDAPIYFHTNALVAPDPGNPHDPNAVAVYLGGALAGYVPRDDAAAFGAELAAIAEGGSVQARAEVSNGPHGGGTYTVRLDVLRPLRLSA